MLCALSDVGIGSGSVEGLLPAPYADGQAAKGLGESRLQKFHTRCLLAELPAMAAGDALFQAMFEGCGGP